MAAILTSMSTPPTPEPPTRREGRRFAIPTPADLRHPGSRRRPSTSDEAPDATPDMPRREVADAEPDTSSEEVPDAEQEVPPVTLPAPDVAATPAATAAAGPRAGGPTPATLPRPGRPSGPVAAAPAPPAPPTRGDTGADTEPAAGAQDLGAEVTRDQPGTEPDTDQGEGARRIFPNPATLMAAGRGVRKVRPGGLRGRRLPKVEETSAGGVVLDLSSDPPAVALIARHDRRSRLLWSLPKGHVEEGETPEQAALREVFEETGLVGRIVAPLGVIDFWFVVEDKRIHKTVHHYVIEAVGGELSDEDVEVEAVEWIPFHQVVRKLAYGDERRLVEKVPQIVPGVK